MLNWIIVIDILICLFIELLKCYTGIAKFINFIPDILNITAIILLVRKQKIKGIYQNANLTGMAGILFLTWVITTGLYPMGTIVDKYQRLRYIAFAYLAYYITEKYITEEFWNRIVKLLFCVQIIHTILVIYQFAVLKTRVDMTNGIFGFLEYNNAPNGLFCLIMGIMGIEYYLKRKLPARRCIAMIGMACVTSALAEIKAFFVLFFIGAIMSISINMCNRKLFYKIIKISILVIVGMSVAYIIMLIIIPENLYAFKSLDNWAFYESYETERTGGLGRMTQISWLYDNEFDKSFSGAMFGKGLGYNTSVVVYELGKLFLNFGIIGLTQFLLFIFWGAIKLFKISKYRPEAAISFIMFVLFVPMIVVWNTTFNRMSMLLFVVIAIGSSGFWNAKERFLCK